MADQARADFEPTGRRIHRLNALAVERERTPGWYCDGAGLYLLVGRRGSSKSWVYRYQQNGQVHFMGLGSLLMVSLKKAREKARVCREQRGDGIDPLDAKRANQRRQRLAAAKAMTFKECAEAYIKAHRAGWKNDKHAAQWPSTLAAYAYPNFGDVAVQYVDQALVMKALLPIWQTKTETATRVRMRIEAVLDWATVRKFRDGDNPARWRGHLDQLLAAPGKLRQVKHHAALPYTELGAFMGRLRDQPGVGALALAFTILTAVRTGEAIGARWDEINFAERLWVVPKERTKGKKKEHEVPLSDAAIGLLEELHKTRRGDFVFAGDRSPRQPISNMAMTMTLRRMGLRGDVATTHGFRSTLRDWAGDCTEFPRELAEMALAHTVGNKTEEAYRRKTALTKRRELMQAWARHCVAATTAEVVPIQAT
jgi:integrase